jgi:alpha-glucosidase (family GH31 glycosyl hydrolase)
MKKYGKKFVFCIVLCLLFSCQIMAGEPAKDSPLQMLWLQKAEGVWSCRIGWPEKVDLLKAAGANPNIEALNKKTSVTFPLDTSQIHATLLSDKLYLRFPLEKDEQIYGLGLQFKNVNRRQRVYYLHVDHYGGSDNGRTHAPVPFYVSSKGYGVLINSARYITVYVGTTVRLDSPNQPPVRDRNTDRRWSSRPLSDAVEVLVPAEGAEIIIFGGISPLDAVSRYNLYCGGGCLPPKWGLGFTYRTPRLYTDQDVIKEAEAFEQQQFPLDFIGLEPGWQSASYPCTYEWDPNRFSRPKEFVQKLLDMNVQTNLWMNPYISPQAAMYKKMLLYVGSHSVWTGAVPDYSMEDAQKIFLDAYEENQLDIGISGVKIDECDGYDYWLWPDVATFPSGIEAEQLRQTYGLYLQRMITGLYHKNNKRTYGLVRASNAGASHLPFVIYNDYYSHEDFITALVNSSFCGILWTPEARSSKTGEEWLRRMQSVCFSPMAMINAWSSRTRPWSFPEVYDAVRDVAYLRMRLLPYLYSTFAEYHFQGIPPIRAMALVETGPKESVEQGKLDDTNNPYEEAIRRDVKDQYMFGPSLLVAPMFTGQTSRSVILPGGKWYDFYTGDFVGEKEIITVHPGLEKIPLFVRDGGIIPLIPKRLHAPKNGEILPLEIRLYGTSEGEFLLYDDDGETYAYENGGYSQTKLTVTKTTDGKLQGQVKRLDDHVYNYGDVEWVFMTK